MTILPLFATYLSSTIVTENTSALDHDNHEFLLPEGQKYSQITKDRRILKQYPKVEKILLTHFKKFAKDVLDCDNDFAITTSWFTKIEKDQYSEFHRHKNSFYSGVYYHDEYSDDSGNIEFDSPIHGLSDFFITNNTNLQNSCSWQIPPIKNLLLLFPSYLNHRIGNHKEDSPRHSLAFNIVPIGEYGGADSTYNTSWFG